jgi:hypothetical protein
MLAGPQKTSVMNGRGRQSVSYPASHAHPIQSSFPLAQRPPRRPESASRRIGNLLHCAPVEPPSDSVVGEGAAEFVKYREAGRLVSGLELFV